MPLTQPPETAMPSVAKGARTQASKASGTRYSREAAKGREKRRRHGDALAGGALRVARAALAGEPHALVGRHGRDERLHALEIDLVARERARIHREEALADARRAPFVGEEAVRLEAVGRAGERAGEKLH